MRDILEFAGLPRARPVSPRLRRTNCWMPRSSTTPASRAASCGIWRCWNTGCKKMRKLSTCCWPCCWAAACRPRRLTQRPAISQSTGPPDAAAASPPSPPSPPSPLSTTGSPPSVRMPRRRAFPPATLDAALTGITPVERVIELDRRQPEFLQTFADYLGRRVTASQVARGQAMLAEHAALLDAVEQQYGVPKAVLVAFWGLETNYGSILGSLNIPASLATLAFDGRRSAFFRSQLLDALRIIDAGHVSRDRHERLVGRCDGAHAVHAVDLPRLCGRWRRRWPHRPVAVAARRHAFGSELPQARRLAGGRAGGHRGAAAAKASTGGSARVAPPSAGGRMDGARRAGGGRRRAAGRRRALPPSCCRRAGRGRPSWCSTTSTW